MDFGFSLPTRGPMANKADLTRLVQAGEALGYAYFTFSDHIVIPRTIAPEYPYSADGRLVSPVDWMEQLTAMAWVAAISDKARLLTSVMGVPHRKPVHTAKILAKRFATLDDLSRIADALGVPWSALLPRLDSNQQPFG